MDEMLKKFAMLASPEQKELEARVAQEGGAEECVKDDKKLRALLKEDGAAAAAQPYVGVGGTTKSQARDASQLEDLRRELRETAEAAMEKNMAKFTGRLKIMEANIVRETEKVVERSSDRVIAELTKEVNKGPQNNILDRVSWLNRSLRQRQV
jgi:hypothetical protein